MQVGKAEQDREAKINGLVVTIADVFMFIASVDGVSKMEQYQRVIDRFWKQTYECALFIQEYKGHGFTRKCSSHQFLLSAVMLTGWFAQVKH